MHGIFGLIGNFIDLIIVLVVVGALIVAGIWIKSYYANVPAGQSFSESLKGLEQNLTGNSKNLYNDAKKLYDEQNFSGSQQKLNELYNTLRSENKIQEAQQVKDFNKSVSR